MVRLGDIGVAPIISLIEAGADANPWIAKPRTSSPRSSPAPRD
jgi:hypothetical protein